MAFSMVKSVQYLTESPMDVLTFDSNGVGTITTARRQSHPIMPTLEGSPLLTE